MSQIFRALGNATITTSFPGHTGNEVYLLENNLQFTIYYNSWDNKENTKKKKNDSHWGYAKESETLYTANHQFKD